MDDSDKNGGAAAAAEPESQPQPQVRIAAQYVKDLSFENPNAPQVLRPHEERPEIEVGIDVQATSLDTSNFEVTLRTTAEAKYGDTTAFLVELLYGGVFTLANIPDDSLQPVLLIECPRLLFPFARRIIADATRDGGFPPLLLDPIDFVGLYRQNMVTLATEEGPGKGGNGSAGESPAT